MNLRRASTSEEASLTLEAFLVTGGIRVRQALVAQYGVQDGLEAAADAMEYACRHWDRVGRMTNPTGYLVRVGRSSRRRSYRWYRKPSLLLPTVPTDLPTVEPGLPKALAELSDRQRTAVLLIHAHGWTLVEAADAMGIKVSSLRNHLSRAMVLLRKSLDATDE